MQKQILPKTKQMKIILLLMHDQEEVMEIAKQSKAQIIPFSTKKELDIRCFC